MESKKIIFVAHILEALTHKMGGVNPLKKEVSWPLGLIISWKSWQHLKTGGSFWMTIEKNPY